MQTKIIGKIQANQNINISTVYSYLIVVLELRNFSKQ